MIQLKNISHMYDEFDGYVLKDITCDIDQGEFVYLTGSVRSGKTTFLRIISGQIKGSKGLLNVYTHLVNKMKKRKTYLIKRQVAAVFSDPDFLLDKTVYENVSYALEVTGCPLEYIEEKVLETLSLVGLKYKALDPFSYCSLDERRRIAIARAIVTDPNVLIVDEPTAGLNHKAEVNMLTLLHKLNKRGMTIIMATKNRDLPQRMPARMIELDRGKLLRDRSKNHMLFILSNEMGEYYIS